MIITARLCAGLLNGNIGVLRTMIGEIVIEKRHQSRGFLILPMCFNVAISISPVLAGLLADPTNPASALFWLVGQNGVLGGTSGVEWLRRYPYALPNVVSAAFLIMSLSLCWLFLDETLPGKEGQRDFGRIIGKTVSKGIYKIVGRGSVRQPQYVPLRASSEDNERQFEDIGDEETTVSARSSLTLATRPVLAAQPDATFHSRPVQMYKHRLTHREIFTPNVILTMLNFMICPLHNATFMQLFPLYLSTPRSHQKVNLPVHFNGGLGLSIPHVGYALSVLGFIGVTVQLLVYPTIQSRFGLMLCFRWSLCLFPIAYTVLPYLSIIPDLTPTTSSTNTDATAEHASGGLYVWCFLAGLALVQVVARTFALPASVILLNNCSPSRDCLGFIHGTGSSLASLSRVIGPLSGAFLFAYGQEIGVVGLVWWALAAVAIFGAIFSHLIREGPGLAS